ncbi:hypothetical protein G6514_009314 [Epicoccum nigrum]|nr:hypothetical protein G6514_009314 [Epicoccum nigrum]
MHVLAELWVGYREQLEESREPRLRRQDILSIAAKNSNNLSLQSELVAYTYEMEAMVNSLTETVIMIKEYLEKLSQMPGFFALTISRRIVSVGLRPYRGRFNITTSSFDDARINTSINSDELLAQFLKHNMDHYQGYIGILRRHRAEAQQKIADLGDKAM